MDSPETELDLWINRVNIDTIRFRLDLPTRFGSGPIASNEVSML